MLLSCNCMQENRLQKKKNSMESEDYDESLLGLLVLKFFFSILLLIL